MTLTDEAKRVRKLHKSYNDTRKQMKAALAICSPGSNTHLNHIKALAELDSREREEEIALGLTPANLGALVTTAFLYVAHCPTVPANRVELDKLLANRMVKASDGLHYEEADEAIREQLQSEFK
jgi:hypothetical protein